MLSEWTEYVLGDIARFSYGKMPKKNLKNTGAFPIYTGYRNAGWYPEKNCHKGDIIVVARGVGGTGDVKLVQSDSFLTNLSIKIDTNQDVIDNKFLYYNYLHSNLRYLDSGSAQSQIVIKDLEQIRIHLPSLSIQKAIAHILGSLDDKIELNRKMNETLEAMAQAMFKSWFVDFDPVIDNALAAGNTIPEELAERAEQRKALGDKRKKLPPEIQNLFPNEFIFTDELGWIPKGWEVEALDDIANYQNGLALQKFRPEDEDDFLPVLKIAQLRQGYADGVEKASPSIKAECIVNNGDVIFSWSGSLLVDVWCGGKVALNQHLFKVTSANYPKWFYYYYTKHHLEGFQKIAADKAVTMGHIKREHLKQAYCAIPCGDVIEDTGSTLKELVSKQIKERLENMSLFKLRDTLLPKLLSGELRIKDAEKLVEGVL